MSTLLQLISLFVSLGPQFATVWQLILQLVQQHQQAHPDAPKRLLGVPSDACPVGQFSNLAALHALHATANAPAFNWQLLLQVWQYIQAHPELMAAIQAIVQSFLHPQPAPVPPPANPPVNPFAT